MPNLFPTEAIASSQEITEQSTGQVKFPRSWRFDFEKGDFVQTTTGKVATADDIQAYVEWCYKALLTSRYRHLIYSRSYGQEFEDLIRRNLTRAGNESEIKRIATETLMVDPRTADIINFKFVWESGTVYVTFDAITVRGDKVEITTQVVSG
ncbi:Protein of unknown function [Desulfotomaculum arcticum]|uniref:DUF2634 domain-containing protein n=1 Tax=Desulfotruncus arcticus DSM 17038 TaxID=1121424 RepID=A0A1I2Y9J9_9FIRM|nr:DUF2634 domain-containing protein [Desulfotruncus arcticus]SFH21051.1 Protein of unknown function [Desulfotomaculum arcticum] [Desulfotruncus arcticus DSM 17038]